MGAAWARHAMCESAFVWSVPSTALSSLQPCQCIVVTTKQFVHLHLGKFE